MDGNRQWTHASGDFSISLNHVKHPTRGEIFFTLFVNAITHRWDTELNKGNWGPETHRISFQVAHYGRPNNVHNRHFYTFDCYSNGVEKMAEIMGVTVEEYMLMPSHIKTLLLLSSDMDWIKPYGIAASKDSEA